jgi:hypothetical protein
VGVCKCTNITLKKVIVHKDKSKGSSSLVDLLLIGSVADDYECPCCGREGNDSMAFDTSSNDLSIFVNPNITSVIYLHLEV